MQHVNSQQLINSHAQLSDLMTTTSNIISSSSPHQIHHQLLPQQQQKQQQFQSSLPSTSHDADNMCQSSQQGQLTSNRNQNLFLHQHQPNYSFTQMQQMPIDVTPPTMPLHFDKDVLLKEINVNAALNDDPDFVIDFDKFKDAAANEKLNKDYKAARTMNLLDDNDTLHDLYSHLPSQLENEDDYRTAISAFFYIYLSKYQYLIETYPTLVDYILVFVYMLVRGYSSGEILKYVKKETTCSSSNINKFVAKTNAVFKLPKSVKRKLENKNDQNAVNNNSKMSSLAQNYKHIIFSLPYVKRELFTIGKFLEDCITLDFAPLHCVVRKASVNLYKSGGARGMSANIDVVPGVTIESRLRIFVMIATTSVKSYKYMNIDDKYCTTFIELLQTILGGKILDRFRVNAATEQSFINIDDFSKVSQLSLEYIPIAFIDKINIHHTKNGDTFSKDAVSSQSFPPHVFLVKSNNYNNIKSHDPDFNIKHCEELRNKYYIEFEDSEDESHDDTNVKGNVSVESNDDDELNGEDGEEEKSKKRVKI